MDRGMTLLLVEDDPDLRAMLEETLRDTPHRVTVAQDGARAMSLIGSQVFDLVVTDVRLPRVDGLTLFRAIRQRSPSTDVILMTAHAQVADAVSALKEGAHDYLTKPFDHEVLLLQVARIAEHRALREGLARAQSELSSRPSGDIIGGSPAIVQLLSTIDTIAHSSAPVAIAGESGTGKELVARLLHQRSGRAGKPFVAVNCAAFPETLIEAELFGHERGAFTGAVRKRDGRFKAADGGTLLLDEVAELPLPVQVKLLRVLQEGTVEPLGCDDSINVDVRLITATHRDLKKRVAEGLFREDLYYRIKVLDIYIPPVRERRGDLPLLLSHFLRKFAQPGREPSPISPRALAALSQYAFPGNVRELAHAVERASVLAQGAEIDLEHLPSDITGVVAPAAATTTEVLPLQAAIKEFEREYLARVLGVANGKKLRAAEMLGISRKSLWEKMRLYGLGEN
jgi:DNA-binding NtrC family response regulator